MKFIVKNLSIISIIVISLISLSLAAKTGGNYSKSCKAMKLNGSTLSAECKNRNGVYMNTSVNLGTCVTNSNGSLARGGGYQNSSRRCVIHRGNTLSCQSKNIQGSWKQASINLDTIIGNNNGKFYGCRSVLNKLIDTI